MKNYTKIGYNISRYGVQLKKILKYNDSSNKYKFQSPTIMQKQNIMITQEQNDSKMSLKNLRKGYREFTPENRVKESPSIALSTTSFDWKTNHRPSFSASRYTNFFSSTPKKNYLKKRTNISHQNSISLIPSYNKKSGLNEEKDRKNKIIDKLSSSYRATYRSNSRNNLSSTYNNKEFNLNSKRSSLQTNDINNFSLNKSYAYESTKRKELSSINSILKNQNKELRQKVNELRYKINDLLNSIKSLKLDNQRAGSAKKILMMKIQNLENELDNNDTIRINELEKKSNIISQLNKEIMYLNTLLDEKENLIIDLSNNLENYNGENNINEGYNKRKKLYNKTEENSDDINFGYNEEVRRINNKELINQINDLREQIENLEYEKESTERENKIMNNNLINNKDRLIQNNERIAKLIKENVTFRKINQKLKNDINQKIKNYISNLNEQKISFEKKQNEYESNINDLRQKLNLLKNKNKILEYTINNICNKNLPQKQNIDDNENIINQFLVQLDKLIEENIILKTHLNEQGQDLNNNFNKDNNIGNNFQQINNLKNDLKEKNNEINNLKEKLKILFNKLNSFKNKNEDLMRNITQLKQKINQLNIKVNNLKNDNFNKQQQIIDISNFNNKLSIQVNNAYSDYYQKTFNNYDLNHNEESKKQIFLLESKNKELQKQLMNNLNKKENHDDKINQIIFEKNNLLKENYNLKEEILSLKNKINELKNKNNIKETENQKLLNIIKNKEIENAKIQNELDNNYRGSEFGKLSMENNININFNQKIEGNNTQTEILKKINYYRKNNDKLFQENSLLKQTLDNIQNGQDETIHNLKDEIKDKSLQIQKLKKENNYLKNNIKNNNDEEKEKEIDLDNINGIDLYRNIASSTGFNDANRIKLYKEEIKNYKIENESDKNQIKTLKEEIKMMKTKIKNFETFGGQMKNMDEFISLLNQVLLNYNPKNKEQKVALNKIKEVLNNIQK